MEKKLKRIDFKTGRFTSNGHEYFVNPESMCFDRVVKFLGWMPQVQTGRSLMELSQIIIDIRKKLSSGNDMMASYVDAYQEALNAELAIIKHNDDWEEANIDLHLDFCALFINRLNEDELVYDVKLMEKKKEDWKTDMNIFDFFLLAKLQQPKYKRILQDLDSQKLSPDQLKELIKSKEK